MIPPDLSFAQIEQQASALDFLSPSSFTFDEAPSPTHSLSIMLPICSFPPKLMVPILIQDIINSSLDHYKCYFTGLPLLVCVRPSY